MTNTATLPSLAGPGTGLGGAWRVIVLNDDHNTFDSVAIALSKSLPGVSHSQGLNIADQIHTTGQSIVWSGHLELAEHYWDQLSGYGLTLAPLEKG